MVKNVSATTSVLTAMKSPMGSLDKLSSQRFPKKNAIYLVNKVITIGFIKKYIVINALQSGLGYAIPMPVISGAPHRSKGEYKVLKNTIVKQRKFLGKFLYKRYQCGYQS